MPSRNRLPSYPLQCAALSLALSMLFFPVPPAGAQTEAEYVPNLESPEKQTEDFITAFATGTAPDAMEELLQHNNFLDEVAVEKGKSAVGQIAESARLYLDHELIADELITARYRALTYVLHFERQPILLQLRFYNPADGIWVAHSWNFIADADALIAAVRDARQKTPAAKKKR